MTAKNHPLNSQNKIIVRPATTQDGQQMAALFMTAWHTNLKDFVPAGFLDQFQHDKQKEKYSARVIDPAWILLVAEFQNNIVGMIGATASNSNSDQTELKSMYIAPLYQRQGIGTLLLNKLFSELKRHNTKNVIVWCIEANKPACSFYEKHGAIRIKNIATPEQYSSFPHNSYNWDL